MIAIINYINLPAIFLFKDVKMPYSVLFALALTKLHLAIARQQQKLLAAQSLAQTVIFTFGDELKCTT
jgi:hypothetical protein